MAFCPHCGQQVAEQASKCIACGKEFEPKAKAARFKGTMMMAPGSGPEGASAGAADAKPAVAKEPPKPVAQTAPAAVAPAPKPPAPASSKVMKATMLGTGGAGLAPPPGRPAPAGAPAPGAPPKAAPPPAAGAWASAAISPAAAKEPAAKEETVPAPPAARANPVEQSASGSEPEQREDSQRFLVGDPMAPGSPPAQAERRGSRGSSTDELPVQPTAKLLAIGFGGIVVIATVGYLAARFMGLLN